MTKYEDKRNPSSVVKPRPSQPVFTQAVALTRPSIVEKIAHAKQWKARCVARRFDGHKTPLFGECSACHCLRISALWPSALTQSLGSMCTSSRFASHRSHLAPISYYEFTCGIHHTQLYKWMHLLVLPPLGLENCSESSDVKCPGQIPSTNIKYLATSGGGGRAAKPLRPFGRAEIEVPRPPLRCAAALGPNPKCVQGVDARPQDLHSNHSLFFSLSFLDFMITRYFPWCSLFSFQMAGCHSMSKCSLKWHTMPHGQKYFGTLSLSKFQQTPYLYALL